MKANQVIFACIFFLCSYQVFSQTAKTWVIIDSKTRLPVDYVYANSEDKSITAVSDEEGKISLLTNFRIKFYTFYKMGYAEQVVLRADLLKKDTILLSEKPYELNEVAITAKIAGKIIEDKHYYVDDYIVLPNADFLIITSMINIKGFSVSYYKRDRGITCTKKFKDEYNERLFKDCFKNYQLVTMAYSRQFTFPTDSTFEFLPSYSRAKFDATIGGITLRIDSHFISKTHEAPESYHLRYYRLAGYSPFLTYKCRYKKQVTDFYTAVYSKEMRDMIQSELDEYANDAKLGNPHPHDNLFFFGRIVKPLYVPVFLKNDTVILFNFQEENIVYLNKFGYVLGSVKIEKFPQYHDFEVFYDEVKQKFYIQITDNDKHFLREINVYDGKLGRTIHLGYPFPKRIQIFNNKLYYLLREHQWDDTGYLYMQSL